MRKIVVGIFLFTVLFQGAVYAQDEDINKKILKDAVVGALTGAVASEVTKDSPQTMVASSTNTDSAVSASQKKSDRSSKAKKNFGKKKRDKKRPHGWNQGQKTGWGNSDVPPGLR